VIGDTDSDQTSFPVDDGPGLTYNGSIDAFVAKISNDTLDRLVDLSVNGNVVYETQATNPLLATVRLRGCQGQETFQVLNAPAMGIPWSYLNAAGQWIPLPANLETVTPFTTTGPADGTYTLFSGSVPVGDYELYYGCDYIKNGHLDISFGAPNAAYDHILVHVR
jgi:hypothetical protein